MIPPVGSPHPFWEAQALRNAVSFRTSDINVSGNRLVDGSENPAPLHGVNISGTEFACGQGDVPQTPAADPGGQPEDTPEAIASIKRWHANAIRIPLDEDCWLGINGIGPSLSQGTSRRPPACSSRSTPSGPPARQTRVLQVGGGDVGLLGVAFAVYG